MTLEQRMADLLAKASVVAEGPIQSVGGAGPTSHSKPSDSEPKYTGPSLYDRMLRRFNNAHSHREKLDAVDWGQRALREVKRRRVRPMTPEEYRFWLMEEYRGDPADVVAVEEGISKTYVRELRKRHGRNPVDGKKAA